jgi:hypothetical protein
VGFGAGFIYGGSKDGGFDWSKALAFGLSGAMVGAGLGMMASGFGLTPGGQILSSTLIGAGMAGFRSKQDPTKPFSWAEWGKSTAVGAVGGAVQGALGLLAGGSFMGQFAAGYVSNFVTQSMEKALGMREEYSGLEMLTAGLGAGIGAKISAAAAAPFQNAVGQVSCAATRGVTRTVAYYAAHAAAGAAGGAVNNALGQLVSGQPWDWGSFWGDVALGGATGTAGAHAQYRNNRVCFVAGTPLLTPDGAKPIEAFRVGDLLLSRDEHHPEGVVEPKAVEEVFVRHGLVMYLTVGDRRVGTTAEHPFWVRGKGWLPAGQIVAGDHLVGHDGQFSVVSAVERTGEFASLYNLRIADYRTYFVGCHEWGWSAWAHNIYLSGRTEEQVAADLQATGISRDHAERVARLGAQGHVDGDALVASLGHPGNGAEAQRRAEAIRAYEADPASARTDFALTDQVLRNHLGGLAEDAYQRMRAADAQGHETATLRDGTVVDVAGKGECARGPCLSLVMDLETGHVYYGQNTGERHSGLPTPLHENATQVAHENQVRSPAPENFGEGWTRLAGYPGSHSEVIAAAQAFQARPGATLPDLAVYNIRTQSLGPGHAEPMTSCMNCTPIMQMDSGRGARPLTGFTVRDNGGQLWSVGGN